MIDPKSRLITIERPKKLQVIEENKVLVLYTHQGLPGTSGDGDTFYTEEDHISFGDVMYFRPDGKVYKASYNSEDLREDFIVSFFMSQSSVSLSHDEEDTLTPKTQISCRFHGKITFPAPVLEPYAVYYLGIDGAITSIPPIEGVMLVIGSAITETDFFINIQQPILLR